MNTKKLSLGAALVALGTGLGTLIFIPLGAAKLYPLQHFINIIAAVALGPGYAVLVAFSISLLRNLLAIGSVLAFPGSMVGALMAALIYKQTRNTVLCAVGELIGTGLFGAVLAYPVARLVMGINFPIFYFVIPFFLSSLAGSIIALMLIKSGVLKSLLKIFTRE